MKRIITLLSAAFVAGLLIAGCNNAAPVAATATQADTTAVMIYSKENCNWKVMKNCKRYVSV